MKSRRFAVFISVVIGWSFCFFCQRTLPSTIGCITASKSESDPRQRSESVDRHDPVITKEDYGRLQNIFVVAYSTSILVGGFLSDYFNPEILLFTSMGTSGLLCIIFPLTTSSFFLSSLVWFFFGLFEGCGWPATAKVVKRMYSPAELGVWWSLLSSSSNIAATISPLFTSFIVENCNWQTSFYITGLIPIVLLFPIAFTMKSNSTQRQPSHQDNTERSTVGHEWYQVFFVSTLQLIIAVYIILWVAKSSVNNWAQLYLQEVCQHRMFHVHVLYLMTETRHVHYLLCTCTYSESVLIIDFSI